MKERLGGFCQILAIFGKGAYNKEKPYYGVRFGVGYGIFGG